MSRDIMHWMNIEVYLINAHPKSCGCHHVRECGCIKSPWTRYLDSLFISFFPPPPPPLQKNNTHTQADRMVMTIPTLLHDREGLVRCSNQSDDSEFFYFNQSVGFDMYY